ncbi:MAG: uncharacterized protein PWR10_2100 [Halanaerobiales bacterium]|nr:uncharacterized protein [Halanaerobiales bacterium]
MVKKIGNFSVNHPRLVIIIFLMITVFFAVQIPHTEIDTAIKSQIPEDLPARININKIEDIFGGTEIVMVGVVADDVLSPGVLKRIKNLSDKMDKIKQIDQVKSPFTVQDITGENDQLIIEDSIKAIPQNQQEIEELRQKIKKNDLVYGNIISSDFKAAAVVGILEENYEDSELLAAVNKIIKETPGPGKIYFTGLPVLRAEAAANMRSDMQHFIPLGLLIMLIFLYICFKQFRGVLLPFVVVVMSIIVSIGLISLLGWKIQLITIILPVILLAVTNDYGIHIIADYQAENITGLKIDEKTLSRKVIENLGNPIIATGITTIVGMLCLLSHIIVPARQLGILASVGIGFALLASLMFIPAVLSLMPRAEPISKKMRKKYLLERLLDKTARFVTGHTKQVIVVSLILVILIATGISRLVIDTNPINYFGKDYDIVKANEIMNKYFGGATNISVLAEGDITDPVVMKKIDEFVQDLKAKENVGEVTAVSTLIRRMNEVLHNEQQEYDRIPDSRNAISQYLLLYSMSADMSKWIDFNQQHALVNARISTNSTNKIKQIVDYISNYIQQHSDSPFVLYGGFAHLLAELVEFIVQGQILSLVLSIVLVSIIVMILFRSPMAGLLAILPLSLAVVCLFGLMGYLNIELNMITATLSSIMIGVGVDYTIHFLWRYRREKQKSDSIEAVKTTLKTTGRGIIFNAFSVIVGFAILLVSNFLLVQFFGMLIVVSISFCLIGALFILPAICIVFKPGFLEPGPGVKGSTEIKSN